MVDPLHGFQNQWGESLSMNNPGFSFKDVLSIEFIYDVP